MTEATWTRQYGRVRFNVDVLGHLVAREFRIRYRRAMLGWAWAVAEPLARMMILTFVFTQVLPLGIPNYSVYLFTGLIAWMWFAAGVRSVTTSPVDRSDLLMQPRLPRLVAPVVSALADGLDYLAALPVLLLFLLLGDGIPLTAALLPVVLIVQLMLILGIGLMLAVVHIHFRDTGLLVDVAMTLGFYLTPVFYEPESVPERFRSVVYLNPMAHILDFHRDILVEGRLPPVREFVTLSILAIGFFLVGLLVHERASPTFVDEL